MMKYTILLVDGTFWECFKQTTTDINKARTFNKVSSAVNTAQTNGFTEYTIVPVTVSFDPFSVTRIEI